MNIYVAGAINEKLEVVYSEMKKVGAVYSVIKDYFTKLGHTVKTPLDTIEFCKGHTDKERFERAMKDISTADYVISEISGPSCGHGFELGVLYSKGFRNVILITSNPNYTSGILKGAFGEPITYRTLDELTKKLEKIIK